MRYRTPEWFQDAKFGIMVQWGVAAVPAWAPVETADTYEAVLQHGWRYLFQNNPDAAWYLNSLRLADSPTRLHHRRHFGDYTKYERFARRFSDELERWEPRAWAELFHETGARYVVTSAKHHDGYLMWPASAPAAASFTARRDVLGELAEAVRSLGMRYGLSYSSMIDWTVQHEPVRDAADLVVARAPADYRAYVTRHFAELIDRYGPDLLWNTGCLPAGINRDELFAAYRTAVPEGVLCGGWRQPSARRRIALQTAAGRAIYSRRARRTALEGAPIDGPADVPAVVFGNPSGTPRRTWELVRSIGRSPGYNADPSAAYLDGAELVHLLADVVSRNGNLLLTVAPRADGSFCRQQRSALAELSAWLSVHGEAIYGTRPWRRSGTTTPEGQQVRFTARPGVLYAIVLGRPKMLALRLPGLDPRVIPRPDGAARFEVHLLGRDHPVEWRREAGGVVVDLPGSFVPSHAIVVRFAWRLPEERGQPFYTDVI